jgi:hypothetical protein
LFDFDGVLTKTATLQAAAWKEMFDAYPGKGRRGPASASGSESHGRRRNSGAPAPHLLRKAVAVLATQSVWSVG